MLLLDKIKLNHYFTIVYDTLTNMSFQSVIASIASKKIGLLPYLYPTNISNGPMGKTTIKQYLTLSISVFTITLPLFELYKHVYENSFSNKSLLNTLIRTRGGSH